MTQRNAKGYLRDHTTRALVVMDNEHHEIHEGEHFISGRRSTIAATQDYLLRSPNSDTRVHLVFTVVADGKTTIDLYEGPTVTANGTAMSAVNNDRASVNTAELLVFHTPTITATGTLIWPGLLGAAGNRGGDSRETAEFILTKNTAYLLRLAGSVDAVVRFYWYEEK